MNKKSSGIFFKILIVAGIVLFGVIAFVIIDSKKTIPAVVPNQTISAGTTITENMLTVVGVPVDTPKGYITDKNSLIGQKSKVTVDPNQLLYVNMIMSSWDDFNDGQSIPDNYIVTALNIPQERAVGGLITVGDSIDLLGIPNSTYAKTTPLEMEDYLGDIAKNNYGKKGINLYWVLANVKILETNSDLSSANESGISEVIGGSGSGGSYYIVALSYSDYLKLKLAEQYLTLWANICPTGNSDFGPMLDLMNQNNITELSDSQTQSVLKDNIPYEDIIDKLTAEVEKQINDSKDKDVVKYNKLKKITVSNMITEINKQNDDTMNKFKDNKLDEINYSSMIDSIVNNITLDSTVSSK